MQNKNKKIFAIQDNEETLIHALNKIRNTKDNILITNCISRLRIGESKLHVIFDTILYNDEKNILIMIKDSSTVTPDVFREMLDVNNVGYNEIKFRDYLHFDKPETSKDLFFATDISNFKFCIDESKRKGIDSCTYYPAMTGHFTIKYFYDKEKQEQLDDYYVKGILELDDKIILIVKEGEESNLYFKKILYELEKMGMNVEIDYSKMIEEPLRKKALIKRNNEEY